MKMNNKVMRVLICLLFAMSTQAQQDTDSITTLETAEVSATRWSQQTLTPAVTKIKIAEQPEINNGMDIPQVLQSVPSVTFSSDAGNNIGYTSMKIRGSDATRINVTINGVPYNDAESQGLFFVNISDILSSTNDVLITNGIGSSTNGSGALGASINIQSELPSMDPTAEWYCNVGSFGTLRNTLKLGTGKLGKYRAEARFSRILSDGYVDRASSDLSSWQVNQSLDIAKNHYLKLLVFGGHERTGQAWNGIPQSDFETDPTENTIGLMEDGEYYADQVDDYTQTHAQLFWNAVWGEHFTSSVGLYTSWGKGYYEEYKQDQSYLKYGLPNYVLGGDTSYSTSLVRRLWLDNILQGINTSIEYNQGRVSNILGIGANIYQGKHYGKVIWAQAGVPNDYTWYDHDADKSELNIFNKFFYQLGRRWTVGVDLQYRAINYQIDGFRDNPNLDVTAKYGFFNPKISLNKKRFHMLGGKADLILFAGRSSKEPIRSDFEADVNNSVLPESVVDIETSLDWGHNGHLLHAGLYGMFYRDQLILTGEINDVGAYTRRNVPKSRRMGIELQYSKQWDKGWFVNSNATFSLNKINEITVYYDDYDNGTQLSETLENTDISYSPNRIAYLEAGHKNIQISDKFKMQASARVKAISKQYLDNTQNDDRLIPSYTTVDVLVSMDIGRAEKFSLYLSALNILNTSYYSNGYTFSYQFGSAFYTENFVYPQARFNWNLGWKLRI